MGQPCRSHSSALRLEKEFTSRKLLPKKLGNEGEKLRRNWDLYRRHLQELAASGGPLRVRNKVIEPLIELLGYPKLEAADNVQTQGRSGEWRKSPVHLQMRRQAPRLDYVVQ